MDRTMFLYSIHRHLARRRYVQPMEVTGAKRTGDIITVLRRGFTIGVSTALHCPCIQESQGGEVEA